MSDANAVALEALADKVRYQERRIEELDAALRAARQASIHEMLGQLRLREAVLLYVGLDVDAFAKQLTEAFGGEIARSVSNSLFVLDNAPVPSEAREAIREATNHGMNRW